MAVFDQRGSFTSGGVGVFSGSSDQSWRFSGAITYLAATGAAGVTAAATVAGAVLGHTARAFIHASSDSISGSFNLPPIGILRFASVCLTAVISRLLSGSPGVIAGP